MPDNDKPTLASLQGLVDTADQIAAELRALMSGRDDREAGVTERERQAKDKAETTFHDREEASARAIITLDDARRRIADLEEELEGAIGAHWATRKQLHAKTLRVQELERRLDGLKESCRKLHDYHIPTAQQRIADLEDERDAYRERLQSVSSHITALKEHIAATLGRHQEKPHE